MLVRRVQVAPGDVVFVKGILEASEGVAAMFADEGGELAIAAPLELRAALDELVADLERDVGARLVAPDAVDTRPGACKDAPAGDARADG
jgi:hypothetical protein